MYLTSPEGGSDAPTRLILQGLEKKHMASVVKTMS